VCLDQLGPTAGKKNPGKEIVYALGKEDKSVQRAKMEVDYKHHGKGYVFGAFHPATGEAFTTCYTRRTAKNWMDFLEQVDTWIDPEVKQVYAILDNLGMHKGTNALLFSLAHPRWEFVFQPTRAAYLNLIEPWWKNLRSLAFSGQCFEAWEPLCEAVEKATAYWNAHRHPFVWGRRRRHHVRRSPGIALVTAHP
jgi:DDE superfamily endonuclease